MSRSCRRLKNWPKIPINKQARRRDFCWIVSSGKDAPGREPELTMEPAGNLTSYRTVAGQQNSEVPCGRRSSVDRDSIKPNDREGREGKGQSGELTIFTTSIACVMVGLAPPIKQVLVASITLRSSRLPRCRRDFPQIIRRSFSLNSMFPRTQASAGTVRKARREVLWPATQYSRTEDSSIFCLHRYPASTIGSSFLYAFPAVRR